MMRSTRALALTCWLSFGLLSLASTPGGLGAQSIPCADRVDRYRIELDTLFERERSSIVPYRKLNKSYFPISGCDLEAITSSLRRSPYFKSVYPPNPWNVGREVVLLSNGSIDVGFAYQHEKKTTVLDYAKFTSK